MNSLYSKAKTSFTNNLINIPGWRTSRKLIIIESDDWGSIRMPSKEVYKKFVKLGFNIAESDYNRLDTLESNKDLEELFNVLQSHHDTFGNPSVITANLIVGNPDFAKIRESNFQDYYFEPVLETLKKYPGRNNVKELWKEGDSLGIFHPQFHGREHVNVVRWMDALKTRLPEMMLTFDNETTFSSVGDYNFMEVLDFNKYEDIVRMKQSLEEGLGLFERIFGYKSKSFIPPCYTWNSDIESTLSKNGVRYLQGLIIQFIPTGTFGHYKKKYHFLGSQNKFGQYFLIRNAFFEPALMKTTDPVGECLRRIRIAFSWRKPAIIGSHRINFIGSLDEKNRINNLKLFDELLSRILELWPDVEFITSDELGRLISENREP